MGQRLDSEPRRSPGNIARRRPGSDSSYKAQHVAPEKIPVIRGAAREEFAHYPQFNWLGCRNNQRTGKLRKSAAPLVRRIAAFPSQKIHAMKIGAFHPTSTFAQSARSYSLDSFLSNHRYQRNYSRSRGLIAGGKNPQNLLGQRERIAAIQRRSVVLCGMSAYDGGLSWGGSQGSERTPASGSRVKVLGDPGFLPGMSG